MLRFPNGEVIGEVGHRDGESQYNHSCIERE